MSENKKEKQFCDIRSHENVYQHFILDLNIKVVKTEGFGSLRKKR